jgi:hypothetical protein
MKPKLLTSVGWVFLVLDAVVLGTPRAMLIVEVGRDGRLHGPRVVAALWVFSAAWLSLLVIWIVAGHLNRPRARVAWYCLVASLAVMAALLLRPELQSY